MLATEEADGLSSKKIHTEHLLLGLLRNEGCLGSLLLRGRGMQFASTREELSRNPHDDSKIESFTRESPPLPEGVVEERARIKSILSRMEQAIANRDLSAARSCSEEERIARDRLRSLYKDRALSGWLFE